MFSMHENCTVRAAATTPQPRRLDDRRADARPVRHWL